MRSRFQPSAATLALALAALVMLPSGTSASDAPEASEPSTDASEVDAAGDGQPEPAQEPIVGLTLEDTRERVSATEVALRVTMLQKESDDRNLAGARLAVEELRDETHDIAQSTVENAITNYRQTDIDAGLLEVRDLNEGLRANALGDAAIVADTETFDEYRDKIKDLELAESNLLAEIDENEELSAEVAELQRQLESEQSWLAEIEERELHRQVRIESAKEATLAQVLGTKQGYYLRTCPVAGRHSFIDSWGFPRSGGRRHKGVDLLAAPGVPIVAPVNGRVEYRSNRVGGRSFHLFGEHGNYFYGTHLSGYGDVQGEVKAGQVIGYVGDDGNAAGIPHLHFEIHAGGRGNQINPYVDVSIVCDGAR